MVDERTTAARMPIRISSLSRRTPDRKIIAATVLPADNLGKTIGGIVSAPEQRFNR